MSKIVSYLISFIVMILLFLVIIYVGFELSIRSTVVKMNLDGSNYYELAEKGIKDRIKDYVVNEDILKDYLNIINQDMIKKDIDLVISKKDFDHYDEFYDVIKKYDDSKEVCELYAKNINKIYRSNIFPVMEFSILNSLKLQTDFIPFLLIFIVLLSTSIVILKCITNKRLFLDVSMIGTGILMVLLLVLRYYLKGLYYTNDYFTIFIKRIIDTNVITDIALFLLLFLCLVIFRIIVKKRSK